ncbi:MAG TPA: hypothetical protein VGL72_28800 [Bryobacteraceae bacterium]|jgi:hypothetical protein
MQRRQFLELLPAGVAALRSSGATTSSSTLPHAHWIDKGLIDGGGSHETYLFMVRRGGERLDARKEYERDQSEDTIRGLKNAGVEVFHTHFYKGFGMAAEMPEMRDSIKAAAFAHSLGMRVDLYIQWNTLMYETFFAEEPRAKDWVQRDAVGRPIMLTYGFQQSYRYRPCFKNQDYLDYLKKIVRFAVQEAKTDFIHFDNFDLNAEPDSCHCPWCVKGLRDHIKAKYTPEQRIERFGFSNVDYVNPPEWNAQNPPAKMQIIFDPMIQEWIDFRCQLMTDALRQMASYAKSMNPEVVIEVNPHGITGGNRAWEAGLDHARFLPLTEVFWTEERNQPGVESDGRVVSKIRSYKLGRAFNNIVLTYNFQDELAIAECLAFNQTIGWAGIYPLTPGMLKYIAFYRANRDLFKSSRDLADVAILRSYASITYNQARCQLSAILAEQALIEGAVPFHLIFDQHLEKLANYRALVLPDSECLSDAQIGLIENYVKGGGSLVAIGSAGMYDQWRRLRVKPGLAALVDHQPGARAYEEHVEHHADQGEPQRKQVGRGRVFYLPALRFDGPLPEYGPFFNIGNRYWKNPANAGEFIEGLSWAIGGNPSVHVEGPRHLVANAAELPARKMTPVHLVNYAAHNGPLANVKVTCHNPKSSRIASVKLYSPDQAGPVQANVADATFSVPEIKTYVIAAVEWA